MHVGFTGSRRGLSREQGKSLDLWLRENFLYKSRTISFHHGDCLGSDKEAHDLLLELYNVPDDFLYDKTKLDIIIHPPIKDTFRAFCIPYSQIRVPKDYLKRNHDIVDESKFLIACPKEIKNVIRSGTWATIRYAVKKNKPVLMFCPDGKIISLKDGKTEALN